MSNLTLNRFGSHRILSPGIRATFKADMLGFLRGGTAPENIIPVGDIAERLFDDAIARTFDATHRGDEISREEAYQQLYHTIRVMNYVQYVQRITREGNN